MYISNNVIVSANKGAQRLMKELKEEPPKIQKISYYLFIDIFSILNNNKNISAEKVIKELHKTIYLSEESGWINLRNSKDKYYSKFWDIFITTNKDGNKCDVSEFKRNLREKYGDKGNIYNFFDCLINKLYPNFKELEEKSYCFNYLWLDQFKIISFNARIDESIEKELLHIFYSQFLSDIVLHIEQYLIQHHIEYNNFKFQKINIDDSKKAYSVVDRLSIRLKGLDDYYFNSDELNNIFKDKSLDKLQLFDYEKYNKYYLIAHQQLWDDYEEVWNGEQLVIFRSSGNKKNNRDIMLIVQTSIVDDNSEYKNFKFKKIYNNETTINIDEKDIAIEDELKSFKVFLNDDKIDNTHLIDSIKTIVNE